jgi:hypothetical protein
LTFGTLTIFGPLDAKIVTEVPAATRSRSPGWS